jgi:hypothetical protein
MTKVGTFTAQLEAIGFDVKLPTALGGIDKLKPKV